MSFPHKDNSLPQKEKHCEVEETCTQNKFYCTVCVRSKLADYKTFDYYETDEYDGEEYGN